MRNPQCEEVICSRKIAGFFSFRIVISAQQPSQLFSPFVKDKPQRNGFLWRLWPLVHFLWFFWHYYYSIVFWQEAQREKGRACSKWLGNWTWVSCIEDRLGKHWLKGSLIPSLEAKDKDKNDKKIFPTVFHFTVLWKSIPTLWIF